jgi:hypothetical protein
MAIGGALAIIKSSLTPLPKSSEIWLVTRYKAVVPSTKSSDKSGLLAEMGTQVKSCTSYLDLMWWQKLADSTAERVEREISCEPTELACRLGVEIDHRLLPQTLWGVTYGARHVVLNAALSVPRRRFALAHELAHVLVRTGDVIGRSVEWDEEAFADEFARALLRLAEGFDSVRPRTQDGRPEPWLASWNSLRDTGAAPTYQRVGDIVVCVRCGPRRRSWYCRCARLRNNREEHCLHTS